ncbi:MAG: DUF3035 domain-containing protein [Pseudomonadota bacterium]
MSHHIFAPISLTVIILAGLTGCQATKEQLGLTRHIPDEFTVIERAPLAIPSDFSQLPTPTPGASRPQEISATTHAKSTVLGENSIKSTDITSGAEQNLLAKTGANAVPKNIRSTIDQEAETATEDKRSVVKRLIGLGSTEKSATVVDSEKEAARINKQKSAGQSITGANTPTVEK